MLVGPYGFPTVVNGAAVGAAVNVAVADPVWNGGKGVPGAISPTLMRIMCCT